MKQFISILLISLFVSSCGIYSFTGASIPINAKTVSVSNFITSTTNSPAILNQTITEGLKIFLSQTNLILTDGEGDSLQW